MGHPGALVAVVIVLADLIVEAAPLVVVIAASLELSGEIAKVGRKDDDDEPKTCSDHLGRCLGTPLAAKPGNHHGASLCEACYLHCRNDEWPDGVKILSRGWQSCKYN